MKLNWCLRYQVCKHEPLTQYEKQSCGFLWCSILSPWNPPWGCIVQYEEFTRQKYGLISYKWFRSMKRSWSLIRTQTTQAQWEITENVPHIFLVGEGAIMHGSVIVGNQFAHQALHSHCPETGNEFSIYKSYLKWEMFCTVVPFFYGLG